MYNFAQGDRFSHFLDQPVIVVVYVDQCWHSLEILGKLHTSRCMYVYIEATMLNHKTGSKRVFCSYRKFSPSENASKLERDVGAARRGGRGRNMRVERTFVSQHRKMFPRLYHAWLLCLHTFRPHANCTHNSILVVYRLPFSEPPAAELCR